MSLSFLHEMVDYEPDPDVARWGLQDLQVCSLTNGGYCNSVTRYETDCGTLGYVREGYNEPKTVYVEYNEPVITYAENDAVIPQHLQELSRVAQAEASGLTNPGQACVVAPEWSCQQGQYIDSGQENQGKTADNPGGNEKDKDSDDKEGHDFKIEIQEGNNSFMEEDSVLRYIKIEEDSSTLDGEVGKRLNQMVPIPHVPRINGELPSEDEEISDHERLLQRLQLYGLVENKVQGDGNCQFRSLSDQFYRSPEHHKFLREQVVHQLKSNRETYEGYVPMAYNDYLNQMSRSGEWGDHVTLQAAADWFGVRIFMITSFKGTCYIEILPHTQKSNRLICLSFWAEVHYNSIYPEGEMPVLEGKKKKKWWTL